MLLGREKELVKRSTSASREKNRSLVRVPSNSKLPKDFFRPESYENRSYPTPNMLEFTFMKPLQHDYSVKALRKCTREHQTKPSLKLTL